MTYNPAIPDTNDNLATSQGQMKTNFGQLNTIFAVDHVPYNDATTANRGLHKKVTLSNVSADPALIAPQSEVYSKTISGLEQLFFANSSTVTKLTGFASSVAGNGYTTLPSGLIIQWGTISAGTNGQAIVYPIVFPNASFLTLATIRSNATNRFIATFNTTGTAGFNVALSATSDFQWIALGN